MSRILTPKGWRELELNEHHEKDADGNVIPHEVKKKELAEHKGDKPHEHPHEKDEVEEKYTDAQRAAKEKSRVGDRMHGGSGVVGKEKGGDMAGHRAKRGMYPAGSAMRSDSKPAKTDQAKLKTNLQKKQLNQGDENPANSQHLCAKNVVHEEWGEGSCISEQHAEPDRYGHVAWYDVMFEHGIEERLPVNEVKVTKAEDHMHSSEKKKGK